MRRQIWTAVVRQRKLSRQLSSANRSIAANGRDSPGTSIPAARRLQLQHAFGFPSKVARRMASISTASVESNSDAAASISQPASSLPHRLSLLADLLEKRLGGAQSAIWSKRLHLAQSPDRQRAIAVLGDGRAADPRGLVSSLSIDPFSEDAESRQAIERRAGPNRTIPLAGEDVQSGENVTRIQGVTSSSTANAASRGSELVCNAPFLRECQADILEVGDANASQALTTLLTAPVCVLALDPVRLLDTPLLRQILPELAGKPHVYLVVNRSSIGTGGVEADNGRREIDEEIKRQWDAFTAGPTGDRVSPAAIPSIFHLDSSRALAALNDLGTGLETPGDPSSGARAESFKRFSDGYADSGMVAFSTEFKEGVKRALERQGQVMTPRGTLPGASVVEAHVMERARSYAEHQLAKLTGQADEIAKDASKLEHFAARTVDFLMQSSGSSSVTAVAVSPESIEASLGKARATVRQVLQDRLAWWKVLFWRVDQVADEVGMEVQARWGTALAQQMAFVAGRLESARLEIERAVDKSLSRTQSTLSAASSPPPFHSAILVNELDQISARSAIDPSMLVTPVDARRDQLLAYSVPTLQRRAHQMTWTTLSLVFLSSSLSWSAAIPLELVSAPTGLAVGLLGSLGSLRWAAGRWSKAQANFWKDWQRVEEGVEDDLREVVQQATQGRVLAKVARAVEARKSMSDKRLEVIEVIAKELRSL